MRSRNIKQYTAEFEDVTMLVEAYNQKEALGILLRRVESGDEFTLECSTGAPSFWQVHDDKRGFPKMFRIP